ncbi:HAD-IIB family hydrolase [Erysipelothrix sp. HDW6C]|uniref:HAD-IIB family hydrolase n=1 Tax=Erysipelothrix sp. HDW6C TaxID=2714930 RepID=UPI00140BD368|nr:HAD-IIB family hydrolase [Erysipelothrix sp. HDW6C]QIK70284.1 HAD-IIB family hydrolase [Erysipelothrix sp. HDW6C]
MHRKVLTFDLDGTLINAKNEIIGGEKTLECLQSIHDFGYTLVINTGRLDHDILHICDRYSLPIDIRISQNGAVINEENAMQATLIEKKSALNFYRHIKAMQIRIEMNTISNRYWHNDRDPLFPKEFYDSSIILDDFETVITYQPVVLFLLIGSPQEIETAQSIVDTQFKELLAVKTSNTSLEVMNPSVSKGKAIHELFPDATIVAIGDSENDFSLFDIADKAFIVGGKTHPKAMSCSTILDAIKAID